MIRRPYYGPRVAYYSAAGHRFTTSSREAAHWYVAFLWGRYPDADTVSRVESCPVPGCRGGWISVPGRGRTVRETPCPSHVDAVETIEAYDPSAAAMDGDASRARRRRDAMHNQIPLERIWPGEPATVDEIAALEAEYNRPGPTGEPHPRAGETYAPIYATGEDAARRCLRRLPASLGREYVR